MSQDPPEPRAQPKPAALDAEAEAAAEAEAEAELAALTAELEAATEDLPDLDKLIAEEDVDGVLELAKAFRNGTHGREKDLTEAVHCYEAAAELGSLFGMHASAVFYLTGGPVPRDEKEAATRFRAAADAGYTPSKVYLANLYELGIYFSADAKKADVWYRSVARSAGVEHDEDTIEYARALAELGCARYCLALIEASDTSDDDKTRYRRKALAHGYRPASVRSAAAKLQGKRIGLGKSAGGGAGSGGGAPAKAKAAPERLSEDDLKIASAAGFGPDPELEAALKKAGIDLDSDDDPKSAGQAKDEAATKSKSKKDQAEAKSKKAKSKDDPEKAAARQKRKTQRQVAVSAIFYSLIFMALGLAGGYFLQLWALATLEAGGQVPVVGEQTHFIVPGVAAIVGILPNLLVYRIAAVGKALIVAAVAGGVGEFLWGAATQLAPTRLLQITGFSAGGLVLGLFVFGLLGGARMGKAPRPEDFKTKSLV